jgi:hypothetical protein
MQQLSPNLLLVLEEDVVVANPRWSITRGRESVVPLRKRPLASKFVEPFVPQPPLKTSASTSGFWILRLRIPI